MSSGETKIQSGFEHDSDVSVVPCPGSARVRMAMFDHPVAHDELLRLSGHCHRQSFDDADMAGNLEMGNLAGAQGGHVLGPKLRPGAGITQAQTCSPKRVSGIPNTWA